MYYLFVKCMCKSLDQCFILFFICFLLSCGSSSHFLDTNLLSDISISNMVSHSGFPIYFSDCHFMSRNFKLRYSLIYHFFLLYLGLLRLSPSQESVLFSSRSLIEIIAFWTGLWKTLEGPQGDMVRSGQHDLWPSTSFTPPFLYLHLNQCSPAPLHVTYWGF